MTAVDRHRGWVRPLVLGALLVAALLLERYLLAALVAFAALFTAQLAVVRPDRYARLLAAERRIAHAAGAVVGGILLTLVFAVVILPLWAGAWLFGIDPLRASRRSSWVVPVGRRPAPRRTFTIDRRRRTAAPPPASAALGWALRLLVLVALVLGAVRLVGDRGSGTPEPGYDVTTAAAYAGQPRLLDLLAEQAQAWLTVHYVPNLDFALGDFDGEVVNQVDGRRVSVSPDGDDPAARTVWFFGGSTMYGIGQRDGHTIPSAFARAAVDAGIPTRVENFGVPAYLTFQQALALEAALRDGPPPDLVVFYGGFNDTFSGMLRPLVPGEPGVPSHGFGIDIDALLDDRVAEIIGAEPGDEAHASTLPSAEDRYEGVLAQYERGVALALDLLAPRGIPLVELWQPTVFSRAVPVAGESASLHDIGWDDFQVRRWAAVDRAVRDRLPSRVVDLGGAFDGTTDPVFTDQVHTSELGATIVGAAIFDQVRDHLVDR